MSFAIDAFNYLRMPVKFKRFYFRYKNQEFNLLDVGCGYGSPRKTMKYFKLCNYYGIDRDYCGNDEVDFKLMRRFIKLDLENEALDEVPNGFFDVILFSHVIEHLQNGTRVLSDVVNKLKPGGVIYIEFPGMGSFSSPSGKTSCLHFCDDPTHVKVYPLHEIINVLLDKRLKIIKAGTRRDVVRLFMTPLLVIRGIVMGNMWGGELWDLYGFADYVYAQKAKP